MRGYVNLNRFDTISLETKEDIYYIVISNGRHRFGISCDTKEDAEAKLIAMHNCVSTYDGWYYIDQELEEVRSYKSNSQKKEENK